MRVLAIMVLAAAALAACAPGSGGTSQARTALTVTYWPEGPGAGEPSRWTLGCNPARGTLPRPAVACTRLAQGGRALFARLPRDIVCTEIFGGPQVGRVVGTVAGRKVWATFTRTNGCHISRWNRVSPWLLPTGGITA